MYQLFEYEGGRLDIPLTLVDIPRMHEPKKEQFMMIHEQLKHILSPYEQRVDCICFVAPANSISLSPEEIEFLQSIMFLFPTDQSSDLSTDMSCFFTFADAGEACLEKCLKSSNFKKVKTYLVNWSAFFQKRNEFSDPFWNMNRKSLDNFFNHLKTSQPKTLRLTLEGEPPASDKKENLKSDIWKLQPELNEDLVKLVETKTNIETFKDHQSEIMSDGDFSFTIEEIKQTMQPLQPGKHVTNCMKCFFTCHENCGIPDDDGKKNCSSMRDGYCTVCTDHCIWSDHKNTPCTYHYTSVRVTKSYKEMKTKYEEEKGKTLEFDEYLEHLDTEIEGLLERIRKKIERLTDYKNELQGIEKSPLAGSFNDTIDDMINAERRKKEKGYEKRIKMFHELKRHSKLIRIERQ